MTEIDFLESNLIHSLLWVMADWEGRAHTRGQGAAEEENRDAEAK